MSETTNRAIKSPQDFSAGLVMMAVGLAAYYFASPLPMGKGANLGPGSFPVGVSLFIIAIGALIAFNGWRQIGEDLDWKFVRVLGLLGLLGALFYFAEIIFSKILTGAGISSKSVPYSTLLPAILLVGVIFYITAKAKTNALLGRWIVRGPIFIISSICMFALLIRPAGLIIAAPVLIALACNAQDEKINWKEIAIFTFAITSVCILLFRVALNQAIPIAPWAGY
jgi:Tripartite tricarboxylate transporter TctB family